MFLFLLLFMFKFVHITTLCRTVNWNSSTVSLLSSRLAFTFAEEQQPANFVQTMEQINWRRAEQQLTLELHIIERDWIARQRCFSSQRVSSWIGFLAPDEQMALIFSLQRVYIQLDASPSNIHLQRVDSYATHEDAPLAEHSDFQTIISLPLQILNSASVSAPLFKHS